MAWDNALKMQTSNNIYLFMADFSHLYSGTGAYKSKQKQAWGGGGLSQSPRRAHSWNKWSCKLYLEGKVQREHFFKNKVLRIPMYLIAHPMFQN
jgi:hypothetical protein